MSAHRFATLVDLSSRMLQHIVSPEALVRRFKPQRTPLALKQTQRAPWVRCRADWALTFWTPTPPPALSPQPPRSARDRRWRAFQPLMQLGGALRPRSSAAPLHRASVAAARPHLPLQPAPRRGARGGPRELRGHLRPPRHRIRLPDLGPVGPLGPRARAAPFRGAGERALPPGPAAASPSPPGEAQAEAAGPAPPPQRRPPRAAPPPPPGRPTRPAAPRAAPCSRPCVTCHVSTRPERARGGGEGRFGRWRRAQVGAMLAPC